VDAPGGVPAITEGSATGECVRAQARAGANRPGPSCAGRPQGCGPDRTGPAASAAGLGAGGCGLGVLGGVTVGVDGVVVVLVPSRRRRCARRPLPSDAGSSPMDTQLSEQICASEQRLLPTDKLGRIADRVGWTWPIEIFLIKVFKTFIPKNTLEHY
jgi:hypothetical protein